VCQPVQPVPAAAQGLHGLAGRLRGIRASQIMTPDPVTVPGSMAVSEFIDDYLFRARHQSFPVTRDGTDTVCGLVTLDRIKHVPAGSS